METWGVFKYINNSDRCDERKIIILQVCMMSELARNQSGNATVAHETVVFDATHLQKEVKQMCKLFGKSAQLMSDSIEPFCSLLNMSGGKVERTKHAADYAKQTLEAMFKQHDATEDQMDALDKLYRCAMKRVDGPSSDEDDINRKVEKRPAPSSDEEEHSATKALFSGGHTLFVSPNKESLNGTLQLYKQLKESGAQMPHGALLYVASTPEDVVEQLQPEEVVGLIRSGTIRIVAIPDAGQTQDAFNAFKLELDVKNKFEEEHVGAVVAPFRFAPNPRNPYHSGATICWFERIYKPEEVAEWASDPKHPDRLCTVVLCTKLSQFVNIKTFASEHFDLAVSGERSRTATKKPRYDPRFLDVCIQNAARKMTWCASLGPL